MSKLFKFKPWLAVPDAARHLSVIFEEEVREEDLFRLALDGKLTLSVVFPDAPLGVLFEPVTDDEIEFHDLPSLNGEGIVRVPTRAITLAPSGSWLQKQEKIFPLEDDWPYDLAMIGGEVADVRHEYWLRVGGEREQTTSLDGTFVRDANRFICLQAKLPGEKGEPASYYPLGGLPENGMLVVTPASLNRLAALVNEPAMAVSEKPLATRERTNLLNIVGALLELNGTKEAAIISTLLERYPDKPGIKKRTLEEKFAEAKRSLRGN